MDTRALQLASRFSLPPNSLGYCGKDTAPARLIDCVVSGHCHKVADELAKFIVLNPYLETLSAVTGNSKFSRSVITAYWLGNRQLNRFLPKDYSLLLDNFARQGVPKWLIDELRTGPPKRFIPFHLFQVLHVGVGRASGSVPYNLETINNCMIRWGKVTNIIRPSKSLPASAPLLRVKLFSLSGRAPKYQLVSRSLELPFNRDFLPRLKVGDYVAVHWRQPVKILTPKEVDTLKFWTKTTLAALRA
jgi:hypothetical protein